MPKDATLKHYGPIQLADRIGLERFQLERGQRLELIPAPDRSDGRWSAELVDRLAQHAAEIRTAAGAQSDVGAWRAEELLQERYPTITVHRGTAAELARRGHLPTRGEFKGHTLYCGLALQNGTGLGRRKVQSASTAGQLLNRTASAQALSIRESDFEHLLRAGLLEHSDVAQGPYKGTWTLLYRRADLDRLLRRRSIAWDSVRATPKGARSPLADLPTQKDGS